MAAVLVIYHAITNTISFNETGAINHFAGDFVLKGSAAIAELVALYIISIVAIFAGFKYYNAHKRF